MPPGKPPPVSRCHVVPPSVDLYSPEPGPPDDMFHGCRRTCHSAAYRTLAFDGSNCTSIAPVSASLNSTFCQCAPPSVLRNTPDRKSTRLNSSHVRISYAVFCLKKKKKKKEEIIKKKKKKKQKK